MHFTINSALESMKQMKYCHGSVSPLLHVQAVECNCSSNAETVFRKPDVQFIQDKPRERIHFYEIENTLSLQKSTFLYGNVLLNYFVFTTIEQMYHPGVSPLPRGGHLFFRSEKGRPGGISFLSHNGALVGGTKCCSSFNILVKTWQLFFPFNTRKKLLLELVCVICHKHSMLEFPQVLKADTLGLQFLKLRCRMLENIC